MGAPWAGQTPSCGGVVWWSRVSPLSIAGPLTVEVDLYSPVSVDLAMLVPGVSRAGGGRTVAFSATDFAEAYRLVLLLVQLASIKPA